MKRIVWAACFAIAAAMPLAAAAEEAFTTNAVDVFAGPSSEYPPIGQLPPNARLELFGCLSDWSWCDVGFAGDRGWIYAGDLVIPYRGSRVAVIEYGPRIHLHIVSFSLNTYWGAHYRSRPFYRERTVWMSRVHIQANHGGPAPSGRVATTQVPQPHNAPSARNEHAPRETARAPERQAGPVERTRPAEAARAPAEERRAHVAQQAQQPEQQRKPQHEAQAQHAAPPKQSEQHAQPPSRTAATPQAGRAPEGGQHERAAAPQASRAPESAQRERRAEHEGGKAKEERQPG
ncbi:MAG TPA: SH3 domain-containing protein [Casimicrobiaceae bacterium]|nr:SH3 domain-containing protein [Casimicrobiaceae bacterium]